MPQWRTFSSNAPAQQGTAGGPATPARPEVAQQAERPPLGRTVAMLIGLGGAAIGAAAVAMLVLALGAAPGVGILGSVGEPLGAVPPQDETLFPAAGNRSAQVSAALEEIVVDVAGAVVRPGLHRLQAGDRVGDAIDAAGGFAPRVDLAEAGRSLNLAQPLTDGSKVLVPELGFERLPPTAADDGRIDINRADQALLETLPGVGPVTAGKIIEARSDSRFDAVKELRSRGIVGESVYGRIKNMVRVGR